MFFLPEYGILCKAAQNLPRTTPLEDKVHNPQGRTRCPRQKQGIRRTDSFLFCPDGRSTGTSLRRNVSLFLQNTYHPRTAYPGPARPVWKAVHGKSMSGCSSKRKREKNYYMGRTYFSPEKWSAIGSMDLRSSRLNSSSINVRNSFLCGSEWKQGR